MNITFLKYGLSFLISWLMVFTVVCGQSSNIGTPPVHNFNKEAYNGAPQNWDISQDGQGIMYFANRSGLLVFDGKYWEAYPVKNRTVVWSVKVDEKDKIFVGAQSEIGFFEADDKGKLNYTSLNGLLAPKDLNYADVWDIELLEGKVFFRTGNSVFLYDYKTLKIIHNADAITRLSKVGDAIFLQDNTGVLKLSDDNTFKPFLEVSFFKNEEVSGIHSYQGDTLLVTTLNGGIFLCTKNKMWRWQINDNNRLQNSTIYCSLQPDASTYIFGTTTNGIFTVDKSGRVLRNFTQKLGLQSNNILSLFKDKFDNLWVGLDNGIDYIEKNAPFTYIYPDGDLKAIGYAVQIHQGKIYFGTSTGVYVNDWKAYYNPTMTKDFDFVENTRGQVWNLTVNENDLFLNHHDGAFLIKNNTAFRIPARNGAWMQLRLEENKFLSGHYDGMVILEKDLKGWRKTQDFYHNWRESCRVLVYDKKGYVWVSHPYRGVYKVTFNKGFSAVQKIEKYNSEQGFPSDIKIYVFKIGDETVFCAERGVFSYNAALDQFEPNKKWNDIFGKNTWVKHLKQAPNGDIWYVTEHEVGVLQVTDGGVYKKVAKKVFPQLKNKLISDFELIYPFDEANVFIATEDGFLHYNPKKIAVDTSFQVLIRRVQTIKNDSMVYFSTPLETSEIPTFRYRDNSLRFRFAAAYFANTEDNEYQYFLEGFDKKWSSWTKKTEVEYTNLNAGTYTFKVKGRNINSSESQIRTFTFSIAPPWYASKWAILTYTLLFGMGVFSLIFIPKKRFEREKAALQSEQKQTLLQKEQEHQQQEKIRQEQISQLEKEKLELQIQAKNQELASNTMHLVQKSEMLQKIKGEIARIARNASDKDTAKQLKAITRKITSDEALDEDWAHFSYYFDEVHSDFLKRLHEKYPQLTPNDHRLCAFLRINLTSKEIAPLLNISVRSVEVARYRLRKKLELDSEVNLVEFMMEI